jgi:hypothetical protein
MSAFDLNVDDLLNGTAPMTVLDQPEDNPLQDFLKTGTLPGVAPAVSSPIAAASSSNYMKYIVIALIGLVLFKGMDCND